MKLVFKLTLSLTFLLCLNSETQAQETSATKDGWVLSLRHRVETAPKSGRYHVQWKQESWEPNETAIIVCDMWDYHHCLNATRRGAELAPRMNAVLNKGREQGVTIIHAPSSCMASYEKHAARANAKNTPRANNIPKDIGKWCHNIPEESQVTYPIDQSDGGEDDEPKEHAAWAKKLADMGRKPRSPWLAQTDLLDIHDQDYISDNGEEIWSVLEAKGIKNVILVGVHTNMCVLGRPFGLRQMAQNGKNVVLMRDMTDTMYNPQRKPFVSHFTGTDLIVQYIEKVVCPTITSDQILGRKPFRFQHDHRPRLVIVMGEKEYKTNESLPPFALEQLGKHFSIDYVHANEKDRNDLPGLQLIQDADLVLISVRRRSLPSKQMQLIKDFVAAGKPVLGIRTANHAFSLRGKPAPKGTVVWETWDADVIGGNYTGHHGKSAPVQANALRSSSGHPTLKGINAGKISSPGTLYQVQPLAKGAQHLLEGTIPGKPTEPLAWIYTRADGGKTFYTSLGHVDDFKNETTVKFLRQVVYHMANVPVSDTVRFGE